MYTSAALACVLHFILTIQLRRRLSIALLFFFFDSFCLFFFFNSFHHLVALAASFSSGPSVEPISCFPRTPPTPLPQVRSQAPTSRGRAGQRSGRRQRCGRRERGCQMGLHFRAKVGAELEI